VTFASGAVATVVNSLLSPRETSYLRFDFAHVTVEVSHLYGYDDSHWRVTAAPGHAEEVEQAWATGPGGQASGHGAQFTAVLDAIEAGGKPPVCVTEARATLELIAAIYASAFTGRPVGRGEIGPASPFYRRMDGPGAPWEAPAATVAPPTATAESAVVTEAVVTEARA
jgi:predicted dehydrogenase